MSQLCWGIVAALVGVVLVETARAVRFTDFVPGFDLESGGTLPGTNAIENVVETALSGIETALLVLDWAVVLSGVLAFVVAVVFVVRYVRSRSHRLVLRMRGDDDVEVPVNRADLEGDLAADLTAAIRPGSTGEEGSPVDGRTGGGKTRLGGDRSGTEREQSDRPGTEWIGDEESS